MISKRQHEMHKEVRRRNRQRCWKIVEVENDDFDTHIKTLFHGCNGSRYLPWYSWLKAERKLVDDGGTKYQSGWHVFKEYDTAMNYFLKRFKHKEGRGVVECMAVGLKRKAHSRDEIYLAREIYLVGI